MKDCRELATILAVLLIVVPSDIAMTQNNSPRGQEQISPNRMKVAATAVPLNLFPGGAGSYWIYEGVVRYQASNTVAKEKRVRWRMSIQRVLRRDGATAVIVKGFPSDLVWSSGDAIASESMFVRTDDGRIYRFDSKTGSPEHKFADTHFPIQQVLDEGDLLFRWPPTVGAQPGGGNCPKRSDEMYCWVLDRPSKVSLRGIKGVIAGSYTAYSLAYTTKS